MVDYKVEWLIDWSLELSMKLALSLYGISSNAGCRLVALPPNGQDTRQSQMVRNGSGAIGEVSATSDAVWGI